MFRIIGLIEIFISNKVRQLAVSRLLKNLLGTTLGKEASGKEINDDKCILTQLFLAQTIVKLLRAKIFRISIVFICLCLQKSKITIIQRVGTCLS